MQNNKKEIKQYFETWREVIADGSLSLVEFKLLIYLQQTNFEKPRFAYDTLAKNIGLKRDDEERTKKGKGTVGQGRKNTIWRSVKNLVAKGYLVKTRIAREKASPIAQLEFVDRLKKPKGLPVIQGYVVGVEERLPASRRGAYQEVDGGVYGAHGYNGNIDNETINNDYGYQNFSQESINIDENVVSVEGFKGVGDEQNVTVFTNVVQSGQYAPVIPLALELFPDWDEKELKKYLADYTGKATAEDFILALNRLKAESWERGYKSISHFFGDKGARRIYEAVKSRKEIEQQKIEKAKYEAKQKAETERRKEREELDRIEYAKKPEMEDQALELLKVAKGNGYEQKSSFDLGLEPLARDFRNLLNEGKSYEEIQEAIIRTGKEYFLGWERETFRKYTILSPTAQ